MKVIDMHCDTISILYHRPELNLRDNDLNISINKMLQGDYLAQCFAMFIPLKSTNNAFETCNEMMDVYFREIEKNKDLINYALTGTEIEENLKKGKMSSILTIEEGGTTKGNLAFLHTFYRLGVRMMTLTWNFENELGYPNVHAVKPDGSKDTTIPEERGLTPTGIEIIKEMEKIGMIIDVSHLSDGGFWDVINHTTKPFVASHSNARSVCNHVRNMSDDMILALAKRGGVMGINYFADFLEVPPADKTGFMSTVDNMVKHINYIKNLAGIDVIGLGSDFDGISQNLEMKDCSMLSMLENRLKEEGYTTEEIEKIFYKNVLRVFKEVLG
ncbi:MAG: membrane dipeptidase [Erysipelotrichaceae bacterium]|mgnify:CR=1 FL=1|nr:membrane dipeptidase [Erysipelotrichaceae bacterium]